MDKTYFNVSSNLYGNQTTSTSNAEVENKITQIFNVYSVSESDVTQIKDFLNGGAGPESMARKQKFIRVFENKGQISFVDKSSMLDKLQALLPFQLNKLSLVDLLILVDSSDYIVTLLSGGFKEAKESKISLEGISQGDIKRIVEVLRRPSLIKNDEYVFFFNIADFLQIPKLKAIVEESLKNHDFDKKLISSVGSLKESQIDGAEKLYDLCLTRQIVMAGNEKDFEFAIQHLENSDEMKFFIRAMSDSWHGPRTINLPLNSVTALELQDRNFFYSDEYKLSLLSKYLPNLESLTLTNHYDMPLTRELLVDLQNFPKLAKLKLDQPVQGEIDAGLLPNLPNLKVIEPDFTLAPYVAHDLERLPNLEIFRVYDYESDIAAVLSKRGFVYSHTSRGYIKEPLLHLEDQVYLQRQ